MRVGAGSRMDGTFSVSSSNGSDRYGFNFLYIESQSLGPALRNYILSYNTGIFESSYQARHVRENLLTVLAPETATDNSLFDILRRLLLRCNALAPITGSEADRAYWNKREDIIALRRSDNPNKHDKIHSIIRSLDRLRTKQLRAEYFEDANALRARGETTDHLISARDGPGYSAALISSKISSLLKDSDGPPDPSRKVTYSNLLVRYLNPGQDQEPMCFLCQATYISWDAVWAYSNKAHAADIWPRDCPECQRAGKKTRL